MSQSPVKTNGSSALEHYFDEWDRLGTLVRRGASFSGRERNRCFLNLGQTRFADVSAVAGLDQLDDGRGVACVDWDQDGDLDLWISNRTGPRVRMLRNDFSRDATHHIAFQLVGQTCNRDAIGARVEILSSTTEGEPGPQQEVVPRRVKTLRAGEGFLSQSSKTIHFGLGMRHLIDEVRVYWPGQRQPQSFYSLPSDRTYRLVQGDAQPTVVPRVAQSHRLDAASESRGDEVPTNASSRTVLTQRVPIESKQFQDLITGRESQVPAGPWLLNLWAAWCQPCVEELALLTSRQTDLKQTGLAIVSLSVDALESADAEQVDADVAADVLRRLAFPFKAGAADRDWVRHLTEITNRVLYPDHPLPLPSSFLIDGGGRLAVIYQGVLDVDQLISDVGLLSASQGEILAAASPFPGSRPIASAEASSLRVARAYLEGGYLEEARQSVRQHLEELAAPTDLEQLARVVAQTVGETDGNAAGPDAPSVNQAVIRRALESERRRLQQMGLRLLCQIERERTAWDDLMVALKQRLELDPHDHAARGELVVVAKRLNQDDAADQALKGLRHRALEDMSARLTLGQTLMQIGRVDEAEDCFQQAVRMSPDNSTAAEFNLAMLYQLSGRSDRAREHYQRVLKVMPHHKESLNNLAWLLATESNDDLDHEEAVRLARQLCQATDRKIPSFLDTLAVALAARGQFSEAEKTVSKALEVARGRGQLDLVEKLEQRLTTFRRREFSPSSQ